MDADLYGGDLREVLSRIHDAMDGRIPSDEWRRLILDLADWLGDQPYASVHSVATALGTASKEVAQENASAVLAGQIAIGADIFRVVASGRLREEEVVHRSEALETIAGRIFAALSDHGTLRPKEIAKHAECDRYQVSKSINRLIKEGIVELDPNSSGELDGRAKYYRLVEKPIGWRRIASRHKRMPSEA